MIITAHFSREAIQSFSGPKELYSIDGHAHRSLRPGGVVPQAMAKLKAFFGEYLVTFAKPSQAA